ncbi:hypothetical protein WQQ_19400 [Hydrocarboniphaga effusa AP103]|uniref:Uncharacterized protein n=1 Tax=Hydrocarboniphaga effusa AP103 TaxID=1172194 RepID=I8TDL9_9GAMM|nr:hypothetical protein WQQ_19400 [Hydrocarboniphaga effusa AP103]
MTARVGARNGAAAMVGKWSEIDRASVRIRAASGLSVGVPEPIVDRAPHLAAPS